MTKFCAKFKEKSEPKLAKPFTRLYSRNPKISKVGSLKFFQHGQKRSGQVATTLAFLIIFLAGCGRYEKERLQTEHYNTAAIGIFQQDSMQFLLSRCSAIKKGDSLILNFFDTSKLSDWYELEVFKTPKGTDCFFRNTYAVTDSSYKPPIFEVLSQSISTNKEQFVPGDDIDGKIDLKIICFYSWPTKYSDTLIVKGSFKSVIEK